MAEENKTPTSIQTPFKERFIRGFLWFSAGFIACKVADGYIEKKKVKRIMG